MEINTTPLWQDVNEILSSNYSLPMRYVSFTLHLIDVDISVRAINVLNLDIIRDYDNSFCDSVLITAVFPIGTYNDIIVPNKENLEATIKTRARDVKDGMLKGTKPVQARYMAKIVEDTHDRVQNAQYGVPSTQTLDITAFVTVEIQLVEKCNFILKTAEVGTIIRSVKVKDALETLLTQQISVFDLADDDKIIGVDVHDPDNDQEVEQIVIPHGTPLTDVPNYIQNEVCGVYERGLNSYVQNKIWYIYPRHDPDRALKEKRYVTIFVIPPNLLPNIENSWMVIGDHWKVLCTGNIQLVNQANASQIENGSGVRYTDSVKSLSEGYPNTSANKTILNRDYIYRHSGGELRGKEKVIPYKTDTFTANAYKQHSYLSSLNAGLVTCLWENSYPRLIEPGMIVKVIFLDRTKKSRVLKGTVLKAHHSTTMIAKGLTNGTWVTNTGLGIWVKNDIDTQTIEETKKVEGASGWMEGADNAPNDSFSDLFGV